MPQCTVIKSLSPSNSQRSIQSDGKVTANMPITSARGLKALKVVEKISWKTDEKTLTAQVKPAANSAPPSTSHIYRVPESKECRSPPATCPRSRGLGR